MKILKSKIFNEFKAYHHFKIDLELMKLINIDTQEIDNSLNLPFIRTKSGEVFYSFLPSNNHFKRYKSNIKHFKSLGIKESHCRVAFDYVQRYIRENSRDHIPPKSHFMSNGSVFLDIGSYIGYGSLKIARLFPDSKVIAVEASPDGYKLLKINVEANNLTKQVTTFNAAVQDCDDSVDFYITEFQQNSIHNKLEDKFENDSKSYSNKVSIKGMTVDAILNECEVKLQDAETVISMEINGAEEKALMGMQKFFKESKKFSLRIATRYNTVSMEETIKKVGDMCNQNVMINKLPPYTFFVRT